MSIDRLKDEFKVLINNSDEIFNAWEHFKLNFQNPTYDGFVLYYMGLNGYLGKTIYHFLLAILSDQ